MDSFSPNVRPVWSQKTGAMSYIDIHQLRIRYPRYYYKNGTSPHFPSVGKARALNFCTNDVKNNV
jgi:hypothetical protein